MGDPDKKLAEQLAKCSSEPCRAGLCQCGRKKYRAVLGCLHVDLRQTTWNLPPCKALNRHKAACRSHSAWARANVIIEA